MFSKQFVLNEQSLSIIGQIGEHMPGGFFIYKGDGSEELLYANEAVFRIFGCKTLEEFSELTGFTFKGLVHPDDYERVKSALRGKEGEARFDVDHLEYRIVRQDGRVRWIEDYGHYVESVVYQGLHYVFISDITDVRERAESAKALRIAVIEALTRSYASVWLITDIKSERFELYRSDDGRDHELPTQEAAQMVRFSDALARYSSLVHEDDRAAFLSRTTTAAIVAGTEDRRTYSVLFRRGSGSDVRYFRLEFARLDVDGSRDSIVCGFKDVDEEVRKEQEVQRSLALRSAVIGALTKVYDSVWLINDVETQHFELLRVDEEMAHLMPANEAARITRFSDAFAFYSNLVLEEDRAGFLSSVTPEAILAGTEGRPIYSVPFRRVFETGVRYYRLEFARIDDENVGGTIVAGFKDVDEEVRKEQEVQRSLALRSAVIGALTKVYDSVWLINDVETQHFELLRVDEEMAHLMPANEAARITRFSDAFAFYSNLVLEEDRAGFLSSVTPEAILAGTEGRPIYSVPFRRVFDTGVRYYRLEFARIDDENVGGTMVAGFKDVDEEVRREQQVQQALRDAVDAANASNKAKSDFLSSMSHDIRTPMNGIIGMTTIAFNNLDDRERVADCLHKIKDSSDHLLSLINEFLDMNKIESGKMELAEEDFNLAELIDTMLTMTRSQIQAHGHTFRVNIVDVEHEQVIGDPRRLQQVFVNIMSNAIKYTPDGGKITLSVREMPTGAQDFGCFEFIFEDNGYGMTEEFLNRIFDPFTRADDRQTAGIQGTGLGMTITRNIVRMMGGDITVESALGQGSKFTVDVYLRLDLEKGIDYDSFRDMRVLVVDDDPVCCESACEILNDMGMNSEWVLSGRAAVDRVRTRHDQGRDFFAAIVDWKMPDFDGVEVTKQMKAIVGEEMPVVIISAYDWADVEHEAREAGATSFVSKPLFRTKLASVFSNLVNSTDEEYDLDNSLMGLEELDLVGRTVLLAEDQQINAEIASDFLEMAGLDVDWAQDGEKAVQMLRDSEDWHYSMIFMDIQMPNMNGYEATRAIRAIDRAYAKEIPIVAMTANAFADDVLNSKRAGMNEHIAKPIDVDALIRVLRTYVK